MAKDQKEVIEEVWSARVRQFAKIDSEDGGVKEGEGRASHREGGEWSGFGGDDVFEEAGDVRQAEGGGVLFVVKEDEVSRPGCEGLDGRGRMPVQCGGVAEPVEEARGLSGVGEHGDRPDVCTDVW